MAEGREVPTLTKPTKHPEQVKKYLSDGAPESLARTVVAKDILAKRRERTISELKDVAMIDPLTGAFNRRYFNEQLQDAFTLTKRQKSENVDTQIGVLMFDLDKFKSINDRFSHGEGDRVLKEFVKCIKGMIREEDVFARVGGEEFALIIRESHKLEPEVLAKMVDRYRRTISEQVSTGAVGATQTEPVTVSVGLVMFPNGATIEKPEDLMGCADKALYEAKKGGRNQAVEFKGVDANGVPQFSKVEVSPKG